MKREYRTDKVLRVIRYMLVAVVVNMLISSQMIIWWNRSRKKCKISMTATGRLELRVITGSILAGSIAGAVMKKRLEQIEGLDRKQI